MNLVPEFSRAIISPWMTCSGQSTYGCIAHKYNFGKITWEWCRHYCHIHTIQTNTNTPTEEQPHANWRSKQMGCYVTVWQIRILLRLWSDLTAGICFYNPTQLNSSHFQCGFQKNRKKQQTKKSNCIISLIYLPESPWSENKILAKRF